MEYDEKSLKIAAKITAATLSESGELDLENAKKTVCFLKTVYKEAASIREDENCDGTFLRAENFYSVELDNVQLHNCNEHPIQCRNGQSVLAKDVVIRRDLTASGLCTEGVKTAQYNTINTYDIVNADSLVIVKDAVAKIEEVYA